MLTKARARFRECIPCLLADLQAANMWLSGFEVVELQSVWEKLLRSVLWIWDVRQQHARYLGPELRQCKAIVKCVCNIAVQGLQCWRLLFRSVWFFQYIPWCTVDQCQCCKNAVILQLLSLQMLDFFLLSIVCLFPGRLTYIRWS